MGHWSDGLGMEKLRRSPFHKSFRPHSLVITTTRGFVGQGEGLGVPFECVDKAGYRRLHHDYDRDGRCYFCPATRAS